MTWGMTAVAGATLVGAVVSSNAANSAANTEANAANNATALQQQEFNTEQANLAPWVAAGTGALTTIQAGLQAGGQFNTPFSMAQFQQDPGYNFQQQQGQAAINASAAGAGKSTAPATAEALATFNQGLANTDYQQALNNYTTQNSNLLNATENIATMGMGGTNLLNQAGQTSTSNINASNMSAANAQAAGTVGSANSITGSLTSGANSLLSANYMQQYLNKLPNATPTTPTPQPASSPGVVVDDPIA